MKKVLIIPIGHVAPDILKEISGALEREFSLKSETGAELPVPENAYDPRRRQYHGTTILDAVREYRQKGFERVLAVTGADLYTFDLNFIFGEADMLTGVAVISLARLRQEFYGSPRDRGLLHARAVKEAVHEIGHTYGLGHCPDPRCIMRFSNTLEDTDRKGPGFCIVCRSKLGRKA